MNSIRFTAKHPSERLFAAALKKKVNNYFKDNDLSTKANAAMVVKSIILISTYIVPFVLILAIPMNAWIALLCCIVMGVGIAGVGMGVMHDACHGAYSRKKWVNDMLSGSLYMLGSNVLNWKIQHNVLHHTFTNVSGLDEDIDYKGPIRLSESTPLKSFHRFQHIYTLFFYGLLTIVMLTNDFVRLKRYSNRGLLASHGKNLKVEFLKMALRKITYFSIVLGLPLWLTSFSIGQILLGFFAMHCIAGIILSFVFQMAHVVEGASQSDSKNDVETDWHIHQLNTTSNFAPDNRLLSWYVGGLNFQIEHHLFPGVCHIHYKKLAIIVEQTAKEHQLPYNQKATFTAALGSHIRRLKELGVS